MVNVSCLHVSSLFAQLSYLEACFSLMFAVGFASVINLLCVLLERKGEG